MKTIDEVRVAFEKMCQSRDKVVKCFQDIRGLIKQKEYIYDKDKKQQEKLRRNFYNKH